nr:receptor-like protein kinase feronia [Quercus suber]
MLTPFFFIFVLFFIFHRITVATATPPYIAVDNITLDCGSFGNSKATDERDWIGDIGSMYGPMEQNNESNSSEAQRQASVESIPYSTARLSYSQFKYVFPVTPARNSFGCTFTQLHTQVLPSLKTFLLSKRARSPYLETSALPFILILQAKRSSVLHKLSMALEMVYRLNIGGSSIPPVLDTGLFRQWSEGINDYLLSDGVNPRVPSLKLKYSKIPKYIAPDAVYQSAASMGPNRTRNSMSNLTWGLPVETGFKYLVRLHFCEIDPEIQISGIREFTIYIDYQLAEETADVILWAGNNDTPYYKDYVVMIQNKGEDNHTLAIDLHPGTDTTLRDAILNGVKCSN